QEKETEKKKRDDEQQVNENEEQRLREAQAGTAVFRGALSGKSKCQLKDIAFVLGISMDGTSKDINSRITGHFEKNKALEDHPRFAEIFNRSRAGPPSTHPTAGTALADVSNSTSNAVAGPSNLVQFYTNFELQPIPYTQYPVTFPHNLDNSAVLDTGNPFAPRDEGEFYHTYDPYMHNSSH
ncbi:hypothetical protein DFH09DRAFT_947221, partial [Mycena vulgaris]